MSFDLYVFDLGRTPTEEDVEAALEDEEDGQDEATLTPSLQSLVDGPMVFHDLDVIEERS